MVLDLCPFTKIRTSASGAKPEIFGWGGRGNIIILICNLRKIQSMTYIHIYIYTCLPALVLEKNINLTKIRLHLQEIIFIEIKYNKITISNYKINSS